MTVWLQVFLGLLGQLQHWVASTTDIYFSQLGRLRSSKITVPAWSDWRESSLPGWLAEGHLLTVTSHDRKGKRESKLSLVFSDKGTTSIIRTSPS